MIKESIVYPSPDNNYPYPRIFHHFYPDKIDLTDWDGTRNEFDMMDHWCNAVAQKYYADTHNGGDWFIELTEDERKLYYDQIAGILSDLDKSHRLDPNDALSVVDWNDDYEYLYPYLRSLNI